MIKFSDLVKKLDGCDHSLMEYPELNPDLVRIAAIDQANSGDISYIEGDKYAANIYQTKASALILPTNNDKLKQEANARNIAWIGVVDPRLAFAYVIDLFYRPFRPAPSIHPRAIIDPSVILGFEVYIGPHVVIYEGAKIGDGVVIFPNVVIYPWVEIGANTILHANCTIHERVQIGANCVIHSGAVIGAEGFGFVPSASGWYKMQQSGYTKLEDGVEVGCNSAIDRPAVGETLIHANTKLDNLVHIAHGCNVGSNCAFAAQVGLAGGVKVGNQVLLGGQVGVANQAVIGDGVIATAQSGLHNRVAPNSLVGGSPAMAHTIYLKSSAIYSRLPEMYQLFRQLQNQIKDESQ